MGDGLADDPNGQIKMATKTLIEDDAEALAVAAQYNLVESMMADAQKRLPESLAAGIGVCICAKRAAPVATIHGPFEFVLVTYMAGFVDGENGWAVMRWSDVAWEDLPRVALEMERVEKQLLPQALGQDSAAQRLETYRRTKTT